MRRRGSYKCGNKNSAVLWTALYILRRERKVKKVYLSPSTQEMNICAMGDMEEDHCNEIMDRITRYLDAAGIAWERNTREMNHITSKDASNAYKPDLHYALHSNASVGQPKARGHRVYICARGGKAEAFADILVQRQAEIYGSAGRVVVPDTRYTEIFATDAPAVIDEIAFHDNSDDARWIHENIDAIAKNKAQAICEALGVAFVEVEEKRAISIDELRRMGYNCIIL